MKNNIVLGLICVLVSTIVEKCKAVNCSSWPSCDPRSRRIMFILDASASIGQTAFDNDMMDFVANSFCGFTSDGSDDVSYEAGVITFNKYIDNIIPFQEFTPDTFEQELLSKVKNQVPVRCCTSHAEAALLARKLFEEAERTSTKEYENIAFFVTDGNPAASDYSSVISDPRAFEFYQRMGISQTDLKDWTRNYPGQSLREERARYAARQLPTQVEALIRSGVRLFFIGGFRCLPRTS